MNFSNQLIDQIKERISLSEAISKRIKLERKGKEFLGLCPFHHEKSPSFTVNDEKQFFHCFGCGEHGDIIKYTSHIMGLDFRETVEHLAHELGLELPKQNNQNHAKNLDTYEVLEQANKWFEQQLFLAKNHLSLSYLYDRGLDKDTINKFRLGYAADDKNALKNHLLKLKFSEKLLIEAGLLIRLENNESYDRFRGRIIFPIFDNKDRIIAFGGRSMNNNIQPKYLNSPETLLFKKKEVLYGENFSKSYALTNKSIIVVEGYMDVIAMHNNGFNETVASLGTALSEHHIQKLWKYSNEPVLLMDGDEAGKRAMQRAADLVIPLIKAGYSIKFASLPSGLDPDEAIKAYGKEFVKKIIDNSVNLSHKLWFNEFSNLQEKSTPEQKAALEKRLNEIVELITDPSVKANYKNFFSQQLWENVKRKKNIGKIEHSSKNSNLNMFAACNISELERQERTLIVLISKFPELLEDHIIEEEFSLIEFSTLILNQLRTEILTIYKQYEVIDTENFIGDLEKLPLLTDILYWAKQHLIFNDYKKFNISVKKAWNYSYNKYLLYLLDSEYKNCLNQLTESSMIKAEQIREQILSLRNEISIMEHLLDT
jgi:DNA primase